MDPATAFSLACGVIQVLDFTTRLVHHTIEIYNGQTDLPSEVNDLRQLTQIFDRAFESFQAPESALGKLGKDCKEFSRQLTVRLRKAGFDDGNLSKNLAESFAKALRRMFNGKDLVALDRELKNLHKRFNLELLISLRNFAIQNQSRQEEILQALKISTSYDAALETKVEAILKMMSPAAEWPARLRQGVLQEIYHGGTVINKTVAVTVVENYEKVIQMQKTILALLRYNGMDDRQAQVSSTHGETFNWALDTSNDSEHEWHSLPEWLEGSGQIYWITGKAGSGKSTLMKYLVFPQSTTCKDDNLHTVSSRVQPFLQRWAGTRTLLIVSFYFWTSTPSKIQASYGALLRTLLYQILSKRCEITKSALTSRWEALLMLGYHSELESWTDGELETHLAAAVRALIDDNNCICFFIDGLDEFAGPSQTLISFIHDLAAIHINVKICVASRPWIQFENAFMMKPHLMLEKLTYRDIKAYVTDIICANAGFAELKVREPEHANNLVESILEKASGVFLWVQLVVASLLAGMHYGDRVEDLQKRLDSLPRDLENLYSRILEELDPEYQEHAAQLICLMETFEGQSNLMVFMFADELNPGSLEQLQAKPLSQEIKIAKQDAMRRRLNSRLKGILEVTESLDTGDKVDLVVAYHHKTVRDFICGTKVNQFLARYLDPSFDPHLQLCIGYIACYKISHILPQQCVPFSLMVLKPHELITLTAGFYHAKTISSSKQNDMFNVVNQVIKVRHEHNISESKSTTTLLVDSLLNLLERILQIYMDKMSQDLLDSILAFVGHSINRWKAGVHPSYLHDIYKLLLDAGADPNCLGDSTIVHLQDPERCFQAGGKDETSGIRKIVLLFLNNGTQCGTNRELKPKKLSSHNRSALESRLPYFRDPVKQPLGFFKTSMVQVFRRSR